MTPNPTRYCAALLLAASFSLPAAAEDAGPAAPAAPAAAPAAPPRPQTAAPTKPGPQGPNATNPLPTARSLTAKPESSAAEGAPVKLKGNPNADLSKDGVKARREAMRRLREAERMLTAAQRAEASDDPKAAEKKEKALKASEKARKQAATALDEMRAERIRSGGELDPAKKKEIEERLAAIDAEREKTREERAKKRRAELEKEYGKKLDDATLRAELSRHAWRVARIEQLIEMAEAAGKTELAERARGLLSRESEKHQRRSADIASGEFAKPSSRSTGATIARPDASAKKPSDPAAKTTPSQPTPAKPAAAAQEGGAQ